MDKKSKKKYFNKNAGQNKKRAEDFSDKNKEKQCVKDAFNILNDALEKNYPHILEKLKKNNLERRLLKEKEEQEKKNNNKIDNNRKVELEIEGQKNNEEKNKEEISIIKKEEIKPDIKKSSNISDLLEQELRDLRQNKDRLFFNFETNCKGVVFLRMDKDFKNDLDINLLITEIVEKIYTSREQLSKAISRFLPVDLAMKAKFDLFKEKAPSIINKYFNNPENYGKTWKLEIKIRNNNSASKSQYMDYLLELIDKSKHRIDYKNPDLTILLEISNDLLCLTVVKNYYMYRMYNLFALSKSDEELKQEKEKLMNYQIMAEERKKLNNNDKSDGLKKDKENDNHIEKINNNKIDENNNLKDLDLPLNESDNFYIFKDEDEDKYKDKDNNILNRSNNEEDENSDIDLI